MSWRATAWATEQREAKGIARLLLILVGNIADDSGVAYPSQTFLAEDAGISLRSVRDNLVRLEVLGFINREPRRRADGSRASDTIRLTMPERQPAKSAASGKRQKPKEQPAGFAGLTTFDTKNLHKDATPSGAPVQELFSLPKKKQGTPREALLTVLDEARAAALLEHRKRLRAPLTAYGADLLARKLAKAPDPNAAADMMILKGWRGFEVDWLTRGNGEPKGLAPSRDPREAF